MSTGSTQPFRASGTLTMAATTTASTASLAGKGEAVLITNASSGIAFIRIGADTTVTATLADTPVLAGGRALLHASTFANTVSVILGSGTGAVYVTRGDGTVY